VTPADILAKLTQAQTLALTGYAEAAGDGREGGSSVEERIAAMCVARNRLRSPTRWADTYKGVCLQNNGRTWQYDCWRPGSGANHTRLMGKAYLLVTDQPLLDPVLDETLFLAGGIISGIILDRTNGATHYYAPKSMVPVNAKPRWVFKNGTEIPPCAVIGDQRFYKGV
jgi:hypothetical protein